MSGLSTEDVDQEWDPTSLWGLVQTVYTFPTLLDTDAELTNVSFEQQETAIAMWTTFCNSIQENYKYAIDNHAAIDCSVSVFVFFAKPFASAKHLLEHVNRRILSCSNDLQGIHAMPADVPKEMVRPIHAFCEAFAVWYCFDESFAAHRSHQCVAVLRRYLEQFVPGG